MTDILINVINLDSKKTDVDTPYASPNLTIYGSMVSLTAAGSNNITTEQTDTGTSTGCSQNKSGNRC